MTNYVNQATQTLIKGLAHDHCPRPPSLLPSHLPTKDTTPPEDADTMAVDKMQAQRADDTALPKFYPHPAKLLQKKNRPKLEARISIPEATKVESQNPLSPPPTEVLMSPLPAANKLHAGHTPIIPRARSPLPDVSSPATPEQEQDDDDDEGLTGPLTLPPQPSDDAEDTIPLHVLDAQLERLRMEREIDSADDASKPPASVDPSSSLSPTTHQVEAVDGVLLKKPRINFGAPLGQA